jgi:hypothetical protein
VVVLAAGLGGGGAALADPPPVNVPAVDAYVEVLPTAGGGAAVGSGPVRSVRLPRTLDRRLRRATGKRAPLLEQIATSSRYGAPPVQPVVRKDARKPRAKPAGGGTVTATSSPPAARSAAPAGKPALDLAAIFSGPDAARTIGLGAIMALTTVVAVALGISRRRAFP